MYIRNRTPTDVLGGEGPVEVYENKPLGSMKSVHEWGSLAFKHIEVLHRNGKMTPRAKKMHLVGYNTKNLTYRRWDPEQPHEITNSAEVSSREKSARNVGRPKAGYDPFPDPGNLFMPGVETEEIQQQESAEKPIAPQVQQTLLRKNNRQRGISPDSVSAQQWSLTTDVEEIAYALRPSRICTSYGRSIGDGKPGEVGYMPPEPITDDDAVSGVDAVGWRASMAEERRSLTEHDVFEWVDPPQGIQAILSRFLYRWKCSQEGKPYRQKSRVVMQGFHEADIGTDKAAPVASQESDHLLIANAAIIMVSFLGKST